MKLDKIKFAQVVAFICRQHAIKFDDWEIVQLDEAIDFEVPDTTGKASADDIDKLMALMTEGTRKIEAIKYHRKITGLGLKESKDAVDKYWVSKGYYNYDATVKAINEVNSVD